jgi:hypothetical protein
MMIMEMGRAYDYQLVIVVVVVVVVVVVIVVVVMVTTVMRYHSDAFILVNR